MRNFFFKLATNYKLCAFFSYSSLSYVSEKNNNNKTFHLVIYKVEWISISTNRCRWMRKTNTAKLTIHIIFKNSDSFQVYGIEQKDMWCTQCKWKKACGRWLQWWWWYDEDDDMMMMIIWWWWLYDDWGALENYGYIW